MNRILLVSSSPRANSYSKQVARALADRLAMPTGSAIKTRDLATDPLPHIDDGFIDAMFSAPDQRTPRQTEALLRSDELLSELFEADILILAVGMINFGIPSGLKAYIDHIVRSGITFKYGANGPEGLLKGKQAYLVAARGGIYSEGPMQHLNFQDTYLRAALGFIGLDQLEVIAVEGVALGSESADRALAEALSTVQTILPDRHHSRVQAAGAGAQ